jgi:hypothetical protein
MALPETTPNLAAPAIESDQKTPLKVTWLQEMLNKKNMVAESPKSKPQEAAPVEQLAFVASKFDEVVGDYRSPIGAVEQPTGPEYLNSIKWGWNELPMSASPLSGSILRLLMAEPGMKEKIEGEIKKGHRFSLAHQPGQQNFILIDIWKEKDKISGELVTRKNSTPYLIKNPESVKPEEPKPEMLPEEKAPVEKSFMKLPTISKEVTPVEDLHAPLPPEMKDTTVEPAPNAHWNLMRSKFSKETFYNKTASGQGRFQREEDKKDQPAFVTEIKKYDKEQKITGPLERLLQGTLEGELLKEWNIAKTIPTNAFLYPEKYLWEGPDGKPMRRTLDNYPIASLRIRDKLVGVLGTFQKMNPLADLEKMPLGEAFDEFAKENLI